MLTSLVLDLSPHKQWPVVMDKIDKDKLTLTVYLEMITEPVLPHQMLARYEGEQQTFTLLFFHLSIT